jgi:hypothetical protein
MPSFFQPLAESEVKWAKLKRLVGAMACALGEPRASVDI